MNFISEEKKTIKKVRELKEKKSFFDGKYIKVSFL